MASRICWTFPLLSQLLQLFCQSLPIPSSSSTSQYLPGCSAVAWEQRLKSQHPESSTVILVIWWCALEDKACSFLSDLRWASKPLCWREMRSQGCPLVLLARLLLRATMLWAPGLCRERDPALGLSQRVLLALPGFKHIFRYKKMEKFYFISCQSLIRTNISLLWNLLWNLLLH